MAICHCETLILYLLSSQRALWFVITQAGMMSKSRKWHLTKPKFAKFPGGGGGPPLEVHAFGTNNYSLFSVTWGWNLCSGIFQTKRTMNTFNLQKSYFQHFKSLHDSPIQCTNRGKIQRSYFGSQNNNMSVLPKPCINISLILFFRSHMNTNP